MKSTIAIIVKRFCAGIRTAICSGCVVAALSLSSAFAAGASPKTLASITASLQSAYAGGFYPGVIRYADELLEQSPAQAAAALRAASYKGEALYRLGRVDEAIVCLSSAAALIGTVDASASADDALTATLCSYWLGRAQRDRAQYDASLESFLKSATTALSARAAGAAGIAGVAGSANAVGSAGVDANAAAATGNAGTAGNVGAAVTGNASAASSATAAGNAPAVSTAAASTATANAAPASRSAAVRKNRAAASADAAFIALQDYYAYSLYYAALSFYDTRAYARALPLLRYVLAHGASYAAADYENAALLLATSYNTLTQYNDCDSLCASLSEAPFTDGTRYRLLLHRGDAQAGLTHFKAAYDCYCRVLAECSSSLAAYAMQKAYEVSAAHRAAVGEEPGAVLAKAQERLGDYPDLVSEFWLRLAIDAYNAGDYAKAESYFDEAEKDGSRDILQKAALYRAELACKTKDAPAALSVLDAARTSLKLSAEEPLYATFFVTEARYAALAGDWKQCVAYADEALAAHDGSVHAVATWWKANALYASGAYVACTRFIEQTAGVGNTTAAKSVAAVSESSLDPELLSLYARALAKAGRASDADAVFSALSARNVLSSDGHLDYAKSLMNGGYLASAAAQAELADGAEAVYIAALSAFNRRQWQEAVTGFTASLQRGLSSPYNGYAQFYCGYAQYRSGSHTAALTTLTDFMDAHKTHPLRFTALITAVRAAVQLGDYARALPLADEAVTVAGSDAEKQEAVLLCAGVYADSSAYRQALSVLSPYVQRRDDFGWQSRYKTAQIQVQMKDYDAAKKSYAALAAEANAGALSEEAAYRHAELVYATGDYNEAVPLFDDYCRRWASGQFFDASLFFSGAATAKLSQIDRAILYYTRVDDLRTDSSYKYAAEKNLVELYKEQKDYAQALAYANKLLTGYGEQAKRDGIERAIEELKLLELGYDEPTAAKEREYNTLGAVRTAAGRNAGTELAALWASSLISKQKGAALAERLLSVQKEHLPEESAAATRNALLVARSQRDQTENAKAAESFLAAAEYARMAAYYNAAAQALYGAVEAFDACARYGDSQQTARSLSALYPKSHYTTSAQAIVEQQR